MASRHLAIAALVLLASGCGTVGNLFGERTETIDAPRTNERTTVQRYLGDVERLLSDDADTTSRAWRELALDYERAPTTTNTLRLALGMATPGHANTDLVRADALLSDEQLLASVHLSLLRSRVSAESVARQASSSATRSNERELAAARAQLELLRSDNARLRRTLEETEQKLAAMTEIERSIRERDEDGASPTDTGSRNE